MRTKYLLSFALGFLVSCQQTDQTNPTTPTVPVPTPLPTASPFVSNPICPAYAPDNDKYMVANRYADNGIDITDRVRNRSYCETLYGVIGPYDCNANVDGEFPGCDVEFLNGIKCPQWFYQDPDFGFWLKCKNNGGVGSCDHFDHWDGVGAYTGSCDKDSKGQPVTGFYVIAHGDTSFKACDKTGLICSNPIRINH